MQASSSFNSLHQSNLAIDYLDGMVGAVRTPTHSNTGAHSKVAS